MSATRTVSVYLLKADVQGPEDAFKTDIGELRRHKVEAKETVGDLFVQEGELGQPEWVRFLSDVTEPPVEDRRRSLSAVLILQSAGRWFAITFGSAARHLLDENCYERDFGLYFALNAVDPDQLRGAEARTFDDYALHTLRQLSRLSSLASLAIDTERELVVSLAGRLGDQDIGKKTDGRDAVRITAELDPAGLANKCAELLDVSQRTTYRQHFPFFDTIKRVRDPQRVAQLESRALNALGQRQMAAFDLFPPQVLSDEIVAFRVAPIARGLTTVAEPDRSLLRYPLPSPRSPADAKNALERFKLRGVDSNGDIVDEWSFFKCLHWEFSEEGKVFVLDAGLWYEVDSSLVEDVQDFAISIGHSGIEWPAATVGEREDAYNERASETLGFALLDKRGVRLPGQTEVEVCDLFNSSRFFVHVKHRKGGSAPLSHLFGQAVVSAECFVTIQEFRQLFEAELEKAKSGYGRFSPATVKAGDYSIVLALITTPAARGNLAANLPFFSKVMLRLAVRRLQSMGFTVYLDAIPTVLAGPTGLPAPAGRRKRGRSKAKGRAPKRQPATP